MGGIAEQNVIGSLLIEPEAIGKITFLKPDMFQNDLYSRIYKEFLRAYDNRYRIDVPVLLSKLADCEIPEELIRKEIMECVRTVTTSAVIVSHARLVKDCYKAHVADKILQSTIISSDDVDARIGELINELEALKDTDRSTVKGLDKIVEENADKYFTEDQAEKVYLGYPQLDGRIGGLEGGDVIVIGARPAVGKSAFVTDIALNLVKQGKRVGFYNLEMQEKQLYERFIVRESGIGMTRLRRAKSFLGDEQAKFRGANKVLKLPNLMISTGSKSPSEIRTEAKNMDYDILIIDYLQLLKTDVFYRNRVSEVGAISKAIKAIAMELNIPVLLLSQLNRALEGRETKEPTMSDLREAGDIEQDASIILLMWNADEERTTKGVRVDKNRQGEFGTHYLKFNGNLMRFEETGKPEFKKVVNKTPFDED